MDIRKLCSLVIIVFSAGYFTSAIAQPSNVNVSRNAQGVFPAERLADLRAFGSRHGLATVNVVLDVEWTPEGYLDEESLFDQRRRVTDAQQELISRLPPGLVSRVHRTPHTPTIIVPLAEPALDAILASPRAMAIEVVEPGRVTLSTMISNSRSQATSVHGRGATGSGWTVAVIDTGVTAAHSALSGKIVSEACYSGAAGSSLCPGGVTASTASGSGVDCSSSVADCGHGTNMAGVIAASGSPTGMAPGASIIAINAASNSGGAASFGWDDIKKALDRVYALRTTYSIAAVNMSLGTTVAYSSTCDSGIHTGIVSAMSNLRSVGIVPVVSSGNSFNKGGISFPACVSHALSVGAVENSTDSIPSFSNSWTHLDVLAAAHGATTVDMFGGTSGTGGTSAAAASISGAIAALRSGWAAGLGSIEGSIKSAGVLLTDTNSVSTPRLRADIALPPRNMMAQTWYCYGQTTVSWESVPTAASYVLEARPLWGGSWYQIYSGTSTSPMVHIDQDSEFRVKACSSGRCGNPNQSGESAYYYPSCM